MTTTARQMMNDKIDARTLDQLTADLITLDGMDQSAETAIVHAAIAASIESRYPEIDAAIWELFEAEIPAVKTYADALLLVRDAG
jgi:hypothetical protein